jgi:transcriptional regulator with XRE-family HTH domain
MFWKHNMSSRIDRADLFRDRLGRALGAASHSQASLARAAGVDRSTISALLAPGTRLPNAALISDCALALGVTSDWLLGLTDRPDTPEQALAAAFCLTEAPRALFDATIFGWHQQAAGYKIRHVPASLPDMLKTDAVVEWEYRDSLGASAAQAIAAFHDQLAWLRGAKSDYEIALPQHEIDSFARGEGYWSGLPLPLRRAQLDQLIALVEGLYPSLRLYLYDAHRVFSSPVTVFGAQRAVIYLGRDYLEFRDAAAITRIASHFDWLVRGARMGEREVPAHLRLLRASLEQNRDHNPDQNRV